MVTGPKLAAASDASSAREALTLVELSVVIPVYNAEATLPALGDRLASALQDLGHAYEVVFVNDGSRDGSWTALQTIAPRLRRVQLINMMRNYGQHNALLAGIRAARGETIVTMDDDLQHPPEEVAALLAALDQGFDVVYGVPAQEQHGLWRDLASQLTKLALSSATGAATARKVSAFRAFRTKLRQAFATFQGPFVSIDVLLTWSTTRFGSVTVRHDSRFAGESQYRFGQLVTHALNMMTGFSTWPLRVASIIGFTFTALGIVVLLFVLIAYLVEGGSVPGFPFLASIVAIFAGAQMFALGVMGEYLSRMHFRMMERPTYAVREHVEGARER